MSLAVDGLASGLDTTSLINQLMEVERLPQVRLRSQLTTQGAVISAYQSMATRLSAVKTAADALAQDSSWTARSAGVSGSSVTASAASGATVGSFTVTVSTVATRASWTTDAAYSLDDPVFNVAEPPLTIRKSDGTSVALYPPSGSMRDVMGTINQAVGLGVTAVAIKVGTDQYRLQVIATEPGSAAAPQGVDNLGVAATATAATDASYAINGVPATATSNTVTDAVPGVTLTLAGAGTSTVTVSDAAAPLADRVQTLVTAVNSALDEVSRQTVRDAQSPRGPLANDSAIRNLSGDLLQAVSDAVGSASAASIGLQTDRQGRLVFDRAAFVEAYAADPGGTRDILAPSAGTGITQRLTAVVDRATAATGTITQAVQGRETTQRDLEAQIENWDRRLSQRRLNLERQFSQLEVALSRLQSQQAWLSGQISQLNANWRTS